jgi:hypothetical protein
MLQIIPDQPQEFLRFVSMEPVARHGLGLDFCRGKHSWLGRLKLPKKNKRGGLSPSALLNSFEWLAL